MPTTIRGFAPTRVVDRRVRCGGSDSLTPNLVRCCATRSCGVQLLKELPQRGRAVPGDGRTDGSGGSRLRAQPDGRATKVALRLVDAYILQFGMKSEEPTVAHQYFSDAELLEIG